GEAGDGKQWQAAKSELDGIRLGTVTLVEGKINPALAAKKYAAWFEKMGINVSKEDPAQVAKRIKGTPIAKELVAALDHWVSVIPGQSLVSVRLLDIARQVDPDPWRDQVRDAATWADAKKLQQLAASVQAEQQSPQLLLLLAGKMQAK